MLCHVQGLSRVCQWQLRGRLRTAIACCLCCSAHPLHTFLLPFFTHFRRLKVEQSTAPLSS